MIARHQALRARVAEQLTRLPIRPTHAPAASAAEAVENQIDAASGKGFFRILLRQTRSSLDPPGPAGAEPGTNNAARLFPAKFPFINSGAARFSRGRRPFSCGRPATPPRYRR